MTEDELLTAILSDSKAEITSFGPIGRASIEKFRRDAFNAGVASVPHAPPPAPPPPPAPDIKPFDIHGQLDEGFLAAGGEIWMHLMLWDDRNGKEHQKVNGYDAWDPRVVAYNLSMMEAIGVTKIHADWRGPWNQNETKALLEYAKRCPILGMQIAPAIDKDAIKQSKIPDPNAAMKAAVDWVRTNFHPLPGAYKKYIFSYGVGNVGVNLTADWGIPVLHSGNNSGPKGYTWLENGQPNYTKDCKFGSFMWKMNDFYPTNPSARYWTPTVKDSVRIFNPYNLSDTWFNSFKRFNAAYKSGIKLEGIIGVTWNDVAEKTHLFPLIEMYLGRKLVF